MRTARGIRLMQHGTVISETRHQPGPTQTASDLLAALVRTLSPRSRVAVLGFAGGGIVAPLRALGWHHRIDAVDVDVQGFALFERLCLPWAGKVKFQHREAARWLRHGRLRYRLIVEDLSVPHNGDTVTPDIVWSTLPRLMKARLTPTGAAVFNLLDPESMSWRQLITRVTRPYTDARIILFRRYENRVVVAGTALPSAAELCDQLTLQLRQVRSILAGQISVRTV